VDWFPAPERHEIYVNIGRDGTLFFNFNSRHRLAISKILELAKIPVRVFVRHEQWQKRQGEAVAALTDKQSRIDHPGLQMVVSLSGAKR
jgi:hypothetical protein